MTPPGYGATLKPAFLTAGAALVAFGLVHAAFITWAVDRTGDPSLLMRLLVMFTAPMAFGIPFALVTTLLMAAAWRATRGTRLRAWVFGATLASGLLPGVGLSLVVGPMGDEAPVHLVLPMLVAILLVPSTLGVLVARRPSGALVGVAVFPIAAMWTMFLMGSGLRGWVVPFVVSLFGILVASGHLMDRLARNIPAQPPSTQASSSAP